MSVLSVTPPPVVARFDPRTGAWTLIAEQAQPVNGMLAVPAKPDGRDRVLLAQARPIGPPAADAAAAPSDAGASASE